MRKLMVPFFMLLLCGAWALAQQSYPSQSSSQSNQTSTSNSNKTSVRGCLSESGGNYMLTSDSGTKYQLAGDTSKLSKHVGHEVEITGTSSAASTPSSTESGASSTSSANGEQTLNVSKLKHIATTCSSSGSTTSGSTTPQ